MGDIHPLLKLARRKGLIDDDVAMDVAREATASGQDPAVILEARKIFTPWITAQLRAELAPAIPEIPGYRIRGQLGHGGMGVVYRAEQISVGREVALKVLAGDRAHDSRFAERFLREARVAAGINHPHVVTVYDAGRAGDVLYLAMELVTGGDADQLTKAAGGSLPQRRAAEIVRDAARGLGAIARAGLVHRDLKPANLFIAADGPAKVADLGIAHCNDREERLTTDGGVLGTPAFMSPEQAVGAVELDVRSDIYARGATLYALVIGNAPFRGKTPFHISAQVIAGPFPDPRLQDPSIPDAVAALVLRATSLNREQRFSTARELEDALQALIPQLSAERLATNATNRPTTRTTGTLSPTDSTLLVNQAASAATTIMPSRRLRLWPLAAVLTAVVLVVSAFVVGRQTSATSTMTANIPVRQTAPADEPKPAWAARSGRDAYGRWADLAVYGIYVRFRWIPAGTFMMGSPLDEMGRREDETQHQVTITRPFWMAETETTQELWFAVSHQNPSRFKKDVQLPVDTVYAENAAEFCTQLTTLVPKLGARLPTEAEWEYACRAGTTTATPGELFDMAWVNRPWDGNATRPVRQGKPNAWGLYDMLGNACEWTQDTYATYPVGPVTDPLATGDKWPVYRGGSFCSQLADCRSAARQKDRENQYLALGTLRIVIPDTQH